MIGRGREVGTGGDRRRDRGMSIAITHVLTIGITTILIAMLLMSGSTLLESETERSAETSLETIGERLADEIENVDRIANESDTDDLSLTVDHPRTVSNTRYTVTLLEACGDAESDTPLVDDDTPCVEMSAHDADVVVHVPFVAGTELETSSVPGGTIEISYEAGTGIELEEGDE